MHRFLRCMICLLLICSFMINLFPTRAEASTIAVGAVLVKAWPVIKAAAVGLGVVGITDWMVDGLVDNLSSNGIVDEDGNMEVYHFGDGLYGISEMLLAGIHSLFFSEEYVKEASSFQTSGTYGYTYYGNPKVTNFTASKPVQIVCFLKPTTTTSTQFREPCEYAFYAVSDQAFSFKTTYTDYSDDRDDGIEYVQLGFGNIIDASTIYGAKLIYGSFDTTSASELLSTGYVSNVEGVEIGNVAPFGSSFYDGYSTWSSTSINVGNDAYYAPIGSTAVAGTPSTGYSQEDVWIGTTPIIIVVPEVGEGGETQPTDPSEPTDPLPLPGEPVTPTLLNRLFGNIGNKIDGIQNSLDQLLQNSGNGGSGDGTDTGNGTGSGNGSGGSWIPPSNHNQFALADLSKFFPFCIPFDLFDFFQLLNADPVAPVLSWEIQDFSGQTYALSVDLSEWDPVAQLFRRLQLFLFICGLAAASRKYIKW